MLMRFIRYGLARYEHYLRYLFIGLQHRYLFRMLVFWYQRLHYALPVPVIRIFVDDGKIIEVAVALFVYVF